MIMMKNTLTFDDFVDELWRYLADSFKKSFKEGLNNKVKTMEPNTVYRLEISSEDCDSPLMQTLYYMDNDLQKVNTPNFSIGYYNDYEDDEYDDDPDIEVKRSRKVVRLN
jgi:hypothetical protein